MVKKVFVVFLLLAVFINISSTAGVAAAGNSTVKIEGEWCNNYNGGELKFFETTSPSLSGGKAASVENSIDDMPAGGYVLNYTVHVPKTGMYSLNFVSSKQGIKAGQAGGSDSLSPFYVNINGSDDIGLNDFSKVKVQDISAVFGKYSMSVSLDQGLNEISFRVKEKRSSDNLCVFYLDYIELELIGAVFETNTVRVEAENYSSSSNNLTFMPASGGPNANYSMGWGVEMKNTVIDPPNGVHTMYDFFAPEEGTYNIYTVCTTLGQDYASNFSIKINDDAYIPVGASAVNRLAASAIGSSFQYYVLKETVHLKKGHNTMDIWVNQLRTKDSIYLMQMDYIEFKNASSDIITEAEWSTDKTFTSKDVLSASGGKDMQLNKTTAPATGYHYIKCDFYVSKSMQYSLYLNISLSLGSTYYSPVEIKFDDGEFTKLTTDNTEFISALTGMVAPYSRYLYKSKIPLEVGAHTFTLQVREMASAQSKYVCSFDKFDLIADKDLSVVRANMENSILNAGESANVKAFPCTSTGEKLREETYTLTYYSDDENIAVVNETGRVTAINPGRTRIRVTASMQGQPEITGYTYVSVLDSDIPISVENVTVARHATDKSVSMDATVIREQTAPVSIISVVYDMENGIPTSLRSYSKIEKSGLHNMLAEKITVPLQNITDNSIVKIYLWDNEENMFPLWNSMEAL